MTADIYRKYAGECMEIMAAVTDPQTRALLLRMAVCWNDLAAQAEKNSQNDIVYETPPRGGAIVQQQQPQQPQQERPQVQPEQKEAQRAEQAQQEEQARPGEPQAAPGDETE